MLYRHGRSGAAALRRGFTLLEIMIVITIIAVIAAFLVPAVMSAFKTAKKVSQVDDMQRLTQGLEAFKSRYGVYPPSRIRLRENTAYNTNEGFDAHSVKMLKSIFPGINLWTYSGPAGEVSNAGAGARPTGKPTFLWCCDFVGKENAVANWTGVYELEGDECLVFFLGGIAQFDRANALTIKLHGFTKRANDPSGIPNTAVPATNTRDLPLVEFDAKRLFVRAGADQIEPPPSGMFDASDATKGGHSFSAAASTQYLNTTAAACLKLPSYLSIGADTKVDSRPWAYFSGYNGNGYRPDDMNLPTTAGTDWFESVDKGDAVMVSTASQQTFQRGDLPLLAGSPPTYREFTSAAPNPYTESPPFAAAAGIYSATQVSNQKIRWAAASTYQLISTGSDGRYGSGGQLPRRQGAAASNNPPFITLIELQPQGSAFDNITSVTGSQTLGEFQGTQLNGN